MPPRSDTALQGLIDLANAGDTAAWGELLAHACERLRRLARKMLRGFPDLRRLGDDRRFAAKRHAAAAPGLGRGRPGSVRHFFNLATVQIRRELLDLADHHFGPEGAAANHHTDGHGLAADDEGGPLGGSPTREEPATPGRLDGFPRPGRGAARRGAAGRRPALVPGPLPGRGRCGPGRLGADGEAALAVRPAAARRGPEGRPPPERMTTPCRRRPARRPAAPLGGAVDQGRDVSAEELCRDCPDLVEPLSGGSRR